MAKAAAPTRDDNRAKTLRLLTQEPGALLQIALAKAKVLLAPTPRGKVQRRFGDVVYEFDFSEHLLSDRYQWGRPAVKSMYVGAYEPLTVAALRRYLKPGDVFVDIGANTGYISAIAASRVGKTGKVFAFEPVPRYFERVARLAELNPGHTIIANNFALGPENTTAEIHVSSTNTGGHTLVPGQIPASALETKLTVPVRRLDDYLEEQGVREVAFIKLDVEGFEFPVLKGASHFLEQTPTRPLIMVETDPSAFTRLGISLQDFKAFMERFGYRAVSLYDPETTMDLTALESLMNVLFLPEKTPV